MEPRTPTQVVLGLFDALNTSDVEGATHRIDSSYHGLDLTRASVTAGREEARDEICAGLAAFRDLTFSIRRSVSDPPHVSLFWSMEGIHDGAFLAIPATHRSVSVNGAGFFTVRETRITRAVHLWDQARLLRDLGLLPDLPGGSAPGAPASDPASG